MQITTIGLDIAKSVFQVHGVDAAGKVSVWRKLQSSELPAFFAGPQPALTTPHSRPCMPPRF
jgi:transposase